MTRNLKYTNKHFINRITPAIASALLLVFVAGSLWLIVEYLNKERERDLMNWQSRLALLAEIRTADVEALLKGKEDQLKLLANNASLRLFLSEYVSENKKDETYNESKR